MNRDREIALETTVEERRLKSPWTDSDGKPCPCFDCRILRDFAKLQAALAAASAGHQAEVERLQRLADNDHRKLLALTSALRDLPELPSVPVLDALSRISKWPDDYESGKQLQRQHGLEKIPPRTEYELGAGVWRRIRSRLTVQEAGEG